MPYTFQDILGNTVTNLELPIDPYNKSDDVGGTGNPPTKRPTTWIPTDYLCLQEIVPEPPVFVPCPYFYAIKPLNGTSPNVIIPIGTYNIPVSYYSSGNELSILLVLNNTVQKPLNYFLADIAQMLASYLTEYVISYNLNTATIQLASNNLFKGVKFNFNDLTNNGFNIGLYVKPVAAPYYTQYTTNDCINTVNLTNDCISYICNLVGEPPIDPPDNPQPRPTAWIGANYACLQFDDPIPPNCPAYGTTNVFYCLNGRLYEVYHNGYCGYINIDRGILQDGVCCPDRPTAWIGSNYTVILLSCLSIKQS